jgi:hypothetical protein
LCWDEDLKMEEMTIDEMKKLWRSLDKMYNILSECDCNGDDQHNNIDYYPGRVYDDYFENISEMKEIVEFVIGKMQARNLSSVTIVNEKN